MFKAVCAADSANFQNGPGYKPIRTERKTRAVIGINIAIGASFAFFDVLVDFFKATLWIMRRQ